MKLTEEGKFKCFFKCSVCLGRNEFELESQLFLKHEAELWAEHKASQEDSNSSAPKSPKSDVAKVLKKFASGRLSPRKPEDQPLMESDEQSYKGE